MSTVHHFFTSSKLKLLSIRTLILLLHTDLWLLSCPNDKILISLFLRSLFYYVFCFMYENYKKIFFKRPFLYFAVLPGNVPACPTGRCWVFKEEPSQPINLERSPPTRWRARHRMRFSGTSNGYKKDGGTGNGRQSDRIAHPAIFFKYSVKCAK